MLLEDGGWAAVNWSDGGVTRGVFPSGVESLRSGFSSIYGLGPGSVVRWTPSGVDSVSVTGRIFDAVEFSSRGELQLAAVTSEGLRVGTVDGGLPIVAPDCRSWSRISNDFVGPVVVESRARGAVFSSLLSFMSPGAMPPACMATLMSSPFFLGAQGTTDCEPVAWRFDNLALQAWCKRSSRSYVGALEDGGASEVLDDVAVSTDARTGAFAGAWPVLRLMESSARTTPLLPTRPPSSAVTVSDEVHGFVPAEVVPAGSVGDQPYSVVLTRGGPWVERLPVKEPSAVSGRPGWAVGQLLAQADAGSSSLFAWNVDVQVQPTAVWSFPGTATAATGRELADGGALTLVATGDAVRFFDGSRSGVAFVPAPHATVTSIALAPDSLGTRFAGGYVVASGRVFRFRADNPVVWRVDELLVSDDEAVEVFFDGSRARVGLRDGSVVSLPTRVLVAPPTTARALDFEQYCQHTFVLTETGLEHLSVTSGFPVGQWSPVIGRPATPGARRGLLYTRPGSLLVFWFDGRITELRGLTCEP
ncbi:MAG: hypothetical protein JNJ54_30005 [Myxococcaceae bacterium]|nr:hypothetical protein [Myxococcaceae bacterium]